jgi:hypothetical protein
MLQFSEEKVIFSLHNVVESLRSQGWDVHNDWDLPSGCVLLVSQGDLALMLILSATDKQWAKSEGKLRKLLEQFRA